MKLNSLPSICAIAPMILSLWALPLAAQKTENQKLLASNGAAHDLLGEAVSISGDTAIVGGSNNGPGHGRAFVFTRSGLTWTQDQELIPSDYGYRYGFSVAVSGNTAIVGAYGDNAFGAYSGSAYVFERASFGSPWTQTRKLLASGGVANQSFGLTVSISGDTALIGSNSGAYVFDRSGGTWPQTGKLVPSTGPASRAVSISGDTALVGTGGELGGNAHVFVRDSLGVWTQQQQLVPGVSTRAYSCSVAVAGDIAVVGDKLNNTKTASAGCAFVFERSAGVWTQTRQLLASDGAPDDDFGFSVAVSGDKIVVGARARDEGGVPNTGSAYVFGPVSGVWTEKAKLLASDRTQDAQFGFSVSVSGDTALVGAPFDSEKGQYAGSAYLFNGVIALKPLPEAGLTVYQNIAGVERLVGNAVLIQPCWAMTVWSGGSTAGLSVHVHDYDVTVFPEQGSPAEQSFGVEAVYPIETCGGASNQPKMALMSLKGPVPGVTPAVLTPSSMSLAGMTATVAGQWRAGLQPVIQPHSLATTVLSNSQAAGVWGSMIESCNLAVLGHTTAIGAGSLGSGIWVRSGTQDMLAGIVAWGPSSGTSLPMVGLRSSSLPASFGSLSCDRGAGSSCLPANCTQCGSMTYASNGVAGPGHAFKLDFAPENHSAIMIWNIGPCITPGSGFPLFCGELLTSFLYGGPFGGGTVTTAAVGGPCTGSATFPFPGPVMPWGLTICSQIAILCPAGGIGLTPAAVSPTL